MEYRYGKNANYEDFSSGRVLYHIKGMTNFPVRLAQEIYGRCLEYSLKKEDILLYDCCCGGGYLITVLGFLNQDTITKIVGSDVDLELLEIAKKNLSLLTLEGMDNRIKEIEKMIEDFNKESHIRARESAIILRGMIKRPIQYEVFRADALKKIKLDEKPDIIITDLPYGQLVDWKGREESFVDKLLDVLYEICTPHTIIGLSMNKKQKIKNDKFIRLEHQKIGKRRFVILRRK